VLGAPRREPFPVLGLKIGLLPVLVRVVRCDDVEGRAAEDHGGGYGFAVVTAAYMRCDLRWSFLAMASSFFWFQPVSSTAATPARFSSLRSITSVAVSVQDARPCALYTMALRSPWHGPLAPPVVSMRAAMAGRAGSATAAVTTGRRSHCHSPSAALWDGLSGDPARLVGLVWSQECGGYL